MDATYIFLIFFSPNKWNGQCEQSLLSDDQLHVTCCSLQIQGNWISVGKIVCISSVNSHVAFRVCVCACVCSSVCSCFALVPYVKHTKVSLLIWREDIWISGGWIGSFEYRPRLLLNLDLIINELHICSLRRKSPSLRTEKFAFSKYG
jgi:hypothetical protein